MANISQQQLEILIKIEKIERGASLFVNESDCEDCVDKGWLESLPAGGYTLTPEGKKKLAGR
ncbi:MAG: hypothetical protein RIA64_06585 [Rhodospirillales bacterium]